MFRMAARKQARQPSGGPSHRSAEDFEAEFDQLDQLAYGPAPVAGGAAEHLRLAPEPPRMAAAPQPAPARASRPYAGPSHPAALPTADLERLLRKPRRAALYAAVMSTFAFLAAVSAVLATLVTLAA